MIKSMTGFGRCELSNEKRKKGAAGQAVQNMNLLFGLDESEGLNLVPMFP